MLEKVEGRRERILRIVRDRGIVRVAELAAELGVSTVTARRDVAALNQLGQVRWLYGSVSWPPDLPNTQGTRPARRSRQVGSRRECVLGMVVPTLEHYFRPIVLGAQTAATAAGVRLIVAVSEYFYSREVVQAQEMVEAGVNGLLLSPSWSISGPIDTEMEQILALDVPAVLVERRLPAGVHEARMDRVGIAHTEGAASAVRHLARLGHQRIAFLSRNTHTFPYIRSGYLAATSALGIADDSLSPRERHLLGDFETFDHEADRLLELRKSKGVQAALVHTDMDAVSLLQQLFVHGVRVPDDFAIVCYGDDYARTTDVPLTAVASPRRALGEAAVQLLLRRLEHPHARRWGLELMPDLQVRGSCGGRTPGKDTDYHGFIGDDCPLATQHLTNT
ncbi:DeoR/GlpR family transcriptional regulator [Streptomyces formicae]|uniref:DeoR/GlpR family transcriptional regulator n=2 Tax=Streptomyces formicae TaxID=1616117 RepID=A0ABY3WK76_9ACTN|nr:DeoR/GlpR family transcriptional regulator [Streptomyces formicae]